GEVGDVAAHVHGRGHDSGAGDAGDADGGGQEVGGEAHGGGRVGAVGAEEVDNVAAVHLEGDVGDGHHRAEVFREVFDVNHGGVSCGRGGSREPGTAARALAVGTDHYWSTPQLITIR